MLLPTEVNEPALCGQESSGYSNISQRLHRGVPFLLGLRASRPPVAVCLRQIPEHVELGGFIFLVGLRYDLEEGLKDLLFVVEGMGHATDGDRHKSAGNIRLC